LLLSDIKEWQKIENVIDLDHLQIRRIVVTRIVAGDPDLETVKGPRIVVMIVVRTGNEAGIVMETNGVEVDHLEPIVIVVKPENVREVLIVDPKVTTGITVITTQAGRVRSLVMSPCLLDPERQLIRIKSSKNWSPKCRKDEKELKR